VIVRLKIWCREYVRNTHFVLKWRWKHAVHLKELWSFQAPPVFFGQLLNLAARARTQLLKLFQNSLLKLSLHEPHEHTQTHIRMQAHVRTHMHILIAPNRSQNSLEQKRPKICHRLCRRPADTRLPLHRSSFLMRWRRWGRPIDTLRFRRSYQRWNSRPHLQHPLRHPLFRLLWLLPALYLWICLTSTHPRKQEIHI